jgi:hypothetical protein
LCEFDNPQFKLIQYEPAKIPFNLILLLKANLAILKGHGLLVKIQKMHSACIAFTMKMNSGDKIQCGNGI